MDLSELTIRDLRQILKQDYDEDVTQAEALEIGSTLVSYFDLLIKTRYQGLKNNYDNKEPKNN